MLNQLAAKRWIAPNTISVQPTQWPITRCSFKVCTLAVPLLTFVQGMPAERQS
jgi:hypothetical protein